MTDELESEIDSIFRTVWDTRSGNVVPQTTDIALTNGGVELDAVLLYADLARSTKLVRTFSDSVSAKIIRAYLSTMTRLIKKNGGYIRSFDGDRVMGVFIGDSKNSSSAKCALQMNYIVQKILRPAAEAKFSSLVTKGFVIDHCVGVAAGPILVVRGGVRGSNDLVFVGTAPNIAAKLSDIRNSLWHTYITWKVYNNLNKASKYSGEENMWTNVSLKLGDENWDCYKSTYWWKP